MAPPTDPGQETRSEVILAEIAKRRQEATEEGQHFTGLGDLDLREKVNRANRVLITWQAWSAAAPKGELLVYTVGLANPTNADQDALFAHLFVGPGNIPTANPPVAVGNAFSAVDPRFPRPSLPRFPGLRLEPAQTSSLSFGVRVPQGVEPSNYLGNTFLFQSKWHDVETYLDRSLFVFEVV